MKGEKITVQVLHDEPMMNHTSFKLGGTADIFVEPENGEELAEAIKGFRKDNIPYYIMGNGSNLLISDRGFRGAIIKIGEKIGSIEIDGEKITAESGALLSVLSRAAAKNNLAGMEFAGGIPGSLGGAVTMNAGAYGGEMKNIIQWVEVLDEGLELKRRNNSEMGFGYRKSVIEPGKSIVIRCCLNLRKGNPEEINSLMADLAEKRKSKQPIHIPSAGSTFKRPEGHFAGKLIEDAGLKSYTMGGAQVSDMHCGFIVNNGNATAQDVYDLIKHVQRVVYEKFKIKLEPEVKILGEF